MEVVGFLDSPLWIDAAPFAGVDFPGFNVTTQRVFKWANVTHLGAACSRAYPGAEGWKCMFGQYRMPHQQQSYMVVASQNDAYQLGENVGHVPDTPAQLKYAAAFARRTKSVVKALRAGCNAGQACGVYSMACFSHSTSLTANGFNANTAAGTTMDFALEQVLGRRQPNTSPTLQWVDECATFACGWGCFLSGTAAAAAADVDSSDRKRP